jgi:hypothetical protein
MNHIELAHFLLLKCQRQPSTLFVCTYSSPLIDYRESSSDVNPRAQVLGQQLAGIGGDLDAGLRNAATDSGAEFSGLGESHGLEIWRNEKFYRVKYSPESHVTFYSGDAQIILHSYSALGHTPLVLIFILGRDSTPDAHGTAAYLAVNIDDKLAGKPMELREVLTHESPTFLAHFPMYHAIDGGIGSGFTRVESEAYAPLVLHMDGPNGAVKFRPAHVRVCQRASCVHTGRKPKPCPAEFSSFQRV